MGSWRTEDVAAWDNILAVFEEAKLEGSKKHYPRYQYHDGSIDQRSYYADARYFIREK